MMTESYHRRRRVSPGGRHFRASRTRQCCRREYGSGFWKGKLYMIIWIFISYFIKEVRNSKTWTSFFSKSKKITFWYEDTNWSRSPMICLDKKKSTVCSKSSFSLSIKIRFAISTLNPTRNRPPEICLYFENRRSNGSDRNWLVKTYKNPPLRRSSIW